MKKILVFVFLGAGLLAQGTAQAGFDHRVPLDTSGIWSIAQSPQFPAALIGATIAGAVWEGGKTRFGKTLWQSLDSAAVAGISTQVMKWTFSRKRPSQTDNPNEWFSGCCNNNSFPSGDVSAVTSLVTPIILEYRHTDPWVYSLAALPAFDMVARVKAQAHWQTDVLAGAAVGFLSGWYAHSRKQPFILSVLPGGFAVGLNRRF